MTTQRVSYDQVKSALSIARGRMLKRETETPTPREAAKVAATKVIKAMRRARSAVDQG